jgi:hypothetical protein
VTVSHTRPIFSGQRVWKRQPDGGVMFEGSSPSRKYWLRIAPRPRAPIRAPRDAVFDALIEATRLVPAILRADRAARSGTAYDDAYYAAFFRDVGPILEQRINESIAAVAATIAGAWEAADRK